MAKWSQQEKMILVKEMEKYYNAKHETMAKAFATTKKELKRKLNSNRSLSSISSMWYDSVGYQYDDLLAESTNQTNKVGNEDELKIQKIKELSDQIDKIKEENEDLERKNKVFESVSAIIKKSLEDVTNGYL